MVRDILRTASLLALTLSISVGLTACGYGIRKPPIESVRLGAIENNTTEPKISDWLFEALVPELMRYGIAVGGGSENTLRGSIDSVEIKSIAEKEGLAVEYEVKISGAFFLDTPGQEPKRLRESGAFIVTFSGEGPLAGVIANKEAAVRGALRDMSAEVVASIVGAR